MPNRILRAACPKPVPDGRFRMTKSPKQKAAPTSQRGGQAACAAVELMISPRWATVQQPANG